LPGRARLGPEVHGARPHSSLRLDPCRRQPGVGHAVFSSGSSSRYAPSDAPEAVPKPMFTPDRTAFSSSCLVQPALRNPLSLGRRAPSLATRRPFNMRATEGLQACGERKPAQHSGCSARVDRLARPIGGTYTAPRSLDRLGEVGIPPPFRLHPMREDINPSPTNGFASSIVRHVAATRNHCMCFVDDEPCKLRGFIFAL